VPLALPPLLRRWRNGSETRRTDIGSLASLADQGVIQAYFDGGEPLIKPGFLDILRAGAPVMMTLLRTHGVGLTRDLALELATIGPGVGWLI
jgi:MoaA/NifB/PqqE/SkfB family radical SAM enzyme